MNEAAALPSRISAIWRLESPAVIGALRRLLRDLDEAEEIAQEALLAALEHWPREGVPDKPGAWLMTTAKHRALDRLRQRRMQERHHEALAQDLEARQAHVVPDLSDSLDERRADDIGDDLLRLIFTACHPLLSPEARAALTLRLLGGLSTAEIARAYLCPEPTVAQRISRAKRTLSEARVPFELPGPTERLQRLGAVLEVVYLIFNEGYVASSGNDWLRIDLMGEAQRLARLLATLMPQEPEVQGLLSLLEIQASRQSARLDAQGAPVLLMDQDRRRWDSLLIHRGLSALATGEALCARQGLAPGYYLLQAGIAACHARATRAEDTDWSLILALYTRLLEGWPSPVIALNRAVALSRAPQGSAAEALLLVDALGSQAAMQRYPWWHSVRGDLLERQGRGHEAALAFQQAAALSLNEKERALLLQRALEAKSKDERNG
ncbi:RNA polymerase sigma factor [Roseateles sp. DB2]|uniref:RNA polymerase sigma factor n=1 Tax=Roseateles sp. DB2 TaxID=3453717 RepID=UPI003EE90186